MFITLKCTCGTLLKVDDIHRGKHVQCPQCGASILVGAADTAVQAEQPLMPRPGALDNNEPDARMPIKRKPAQGSMLTWLALGGCGLFSIFGCFLCSGVGAWYFYFRAPAGDDLKFVHADVIGFVSIRVADVMKSASVKDQLTKLPLEAKKDLDDKLAEMEKKFGLAPSDIERVTLIMRSTDNKDMGIVIRTSKPMDRKKILAAAAENRAEKKHGKFDYFLLTRGQEPAALHFATDRVVLFTPSETALKNFLDQAGKPTKDKAVSRGLQLASAGKHVFVGAFKTDVRTLKMALAHEFDDLAGIKDMHGIIAAGSLEQQLTLELSCLFDRKDQADAAKIDADKLLGKIRKQMQDRPPQGFAPEAIADSVRSLVVEQRGNDLVLKGKTNFDLEPLVEVVGALDLVAPGQIQSINNLKQIGLAMHGFHDVYKGLPNHAILDVKTGEPLLSWRVSVLPFLDQLPLYNEIRRDEPWDSEHNKKFWTRMPNIYQLPGKPNDGKTHYQVFHGSGSAFPKTSRKPPQILAERSDRSMVNITDGTSNTIFVVEAATAVHWMKPDDIRFDGGPQPMAPLGDHWGNGAFCAVMGDGEVIRWRRTMPPNMLQAFITADGGEAVDRDPWEVVAPQRKNRK